MPQTRQNTINKNTFQFEIDYNTNKANSRSNIKVKNCSNHYQATYIGMSAILNTKFLLLNS